jgi:hypothetical protein
MNNSTSVFASLLSIIILILASIVGVQYQKASVENDNLRQRVDSLMIQCQKKDVSLDEATGIALSLSDRMGKLYEMDPETHKKLFSETD